MSSKPQVTTQPVRPSENLNDPGGPREEGGLYAPSGVTQCDQQSGTQDMVMGAEEDIYEIPDAEVEEDVEQLRVAPSP